MQTIGEEGVFYGQSLIVYVNSHMRASNISYTDEGWTHLKLDSFAQHSNVWVRWFTTMCYMKLLVYYTSKSMAGGVKWIVKLTFIIIM